LHKSVARDVSDS